MRKSESVPYTLQETLRRGTAANATQFICVRHGETVSVKPLQPRAHLS